MAIGVKTKTAKTSGKNATAFLVPYNRRSKSYRALNKALDLKYSNLGLVEELYLQKRGAGDAGAVFNYLINWGSGNIPNWAGGMSKTILNTTGSVNICRNKIKFFTAVADTVRIPEFTTDIEVAMGWVQDGKTVMGRKANGSCGTDIVFYEDNPGDFQDSDFWALYKKKKHEFRVHVFNNQIISLQQKAIRVTDEQGQPIPSGAIDFRIRNHRNGFIFKRNEISVPDDVKTQALAAAKAIQGLTFGAVDVIYNQYEDKAYVLEVNTAPGLEGTTLEDYTKAFLSL